MQKTEKKTIEGKSSSTKNIIHKSDKGKKDFPVSKLRTAVPSGLNANSQLLSL